MKNLEVDGAHRRWGFVPYDQLSDRLGLLAREEPARVGIVLVETTWKPSQRPYHKQKLALIMANQRHFALEQARRGVAVRYVVGSESYANLLRPVAHELGPLVVMRPAERELRVALRPLMDDGLIDEIQHEGWLTAPQDFMDAMKGKKQWRMDAFYRLVRKRYNVLMEPNGKPVGGKWSYDGENRLPWPGEPPAPSLPSFEPDAVTREVLAWVSTRFRHHPGRLNPASLPATREDASRLWEWAKSHCMTLFGPYEDAMSHRETNLFHTRISALLNIQRLLPRDIVDATLRMDLPLASKEGFIRQIIGWREFVHHIHEATDGFRNFKGVTPATLESPGDGGYASWGKGRWKAPEGATADGGACPSELGANASLPPAFWGASSGLYCLDHVVETVWEEAYSHHITRLMVLSNWATLLGLSPREITDWFWVAYVDAFDWVVEPNVLGMGTFATGDLMVTKPYVSGSGYINRMSDYCKQCQFNPKKDCPMTRMYWDFLNRNRERLQQNPRLRIAMSSAAKRSDAVQRTDEEVTSYVRRSLQSGDRVDGTTIRSLIQS